MLSSTRLGSTFALTEKRYAQHDEALWQEGDLRTNYTAANKTRNSQTNQRNEKTPSLCAPRERLPNGKVQRLSIDPNRS
jgi:hypothetical protein